MMKSKDRKMISRRNLLLVLSTGSAAAIAGPIAASTEVRAFDPGEYETKSRYRETADVRAFYRTNGYETLRK
jgi:hypothetical protein